MASAYVSKATEQKLQNIEDLKINKKTNLFDHCLGGLSTDLYELQEQPADLFKQGTLIVIFADSQKSAKWTILKAFQNCSFTSSAAFVKYTKVSCHVFCLFFLQELCCLFRLYYRSEPLFRDYNLYDTRRTFKNCNRMVTSAETAIKYIIFFPNV